MRDRTTLLCLMALLAVMTLVPVLYSGYTTNDDVYNALGIDMGWRSPWLFDARRSGRLVHVVAGQLMTVSYGWGSYGVMKAVSFAAILSNIAALALVLRVLTGDARLAILAVTFFFAFIPNTWDYNLLTAYPFTSSFGITAALLSIAAWWSALQGPGAAGGPTWIARLGSRRLAAASALLYAVSLTIYESFMTYAIVFPVMAMVAAPPAWRDRLRRAFRTPHVWVLAVWVVLVVLFKVLLHTEAGQTFNAEGQYEIRLAPAAIGKVLERYVSSVMPMHYLGPYRNLINDFYLGFDTFRGRFVEMFDVIDAAWLAKAAIAAWLAGVTLLSRSPVRRRGLVLLVALALLVLSHLPLAVTAKYQTWVLVHFNHAYITSYYGFLGAVALFALVLDTLAERVWRRRGLSRAFVAVVVTAVFLASYGTDFINGHVSTSQRQMYDKWRAVDAWIDSPVFEALPEDSAVLAPSLWERYPTQTHLWDDYWSVYVQHHGGKRVHMLGREEGWREQARKPESAGKLYYLKVMRERRQDATFLVFARLSSADAGKPLGATDLSVAARAPSHHLRVIGRVFDVGPCRARVMVDGAPASGTFDDLFAARVDRRRGDASWRWTRLTSEGGVIDAASLVVAPSTEPVDGPVALRFGSGFLAGAAAFQWAENEAELTLVDQSDRPVVVNLRLRVRAPSAAAGSGHTLVATVGGDEHRWPVTDQFETRSIRVPIPARSSARVTFSTTAPAIDLVPEGGRRVLIFEPPVAEEERVCAD